MSDPESNKSHAGRATFIIVTVLVIYVGSMGPFCGWYGDTKLSNRQAIYLNTFYAPVSWLHTYTSLEKPLENWQRWWYDFFRERRLQHH